MPDTIWPLVPDTKYCGAVGTRALGPQAPVEYELPREAVAEAIVNAVAHRDYTSNASVQVMLFADRLEVWNPGELPTALTIELLFRPHASIPRNPLIAEPMFLARYAEKAGSGILDMIALCREAGLPSPEFRQSGGQFIQTLGRPRPRATEQVTEQVTEKVVRLLRILEGELNRDQLQSALSLTHRVHFTNTYLNPSLEAGLVEMTLPDKPRSGKQKYRLTPKGRALVVQLQPEQGPKDDV
jgi:predicted HTH transcriptional regulator